MGKLKQVLLILSFVNLESFAHASTMETLKETTLVQLNSAKTKLFDTIHQGQSFLGTIVHVKNYSFNPVTAPALTSQSTRDLIPLQTDDLRTPKTIIVYTPTTSDLYRQNVLQNAYVEWFLMALLLNYDHQETAPPAIFFAAYFLWTFYNIDRAYELRHCNKKIHEKLMDKLKTQTKEA